LNKDGKKDAGQIVVSREQVFDAIDEWHQGHAHMGQVFQHHPATSAHLLQDVCCLLQEKSVSNTQRQQETHNVFELAIKI
jgi:hypothetical protein